MDNIIYDYQFYPSLAHLLEHLDINADTLELLPDDYVIVVETTRIGKPFALTNAHLLEYMLEQFGETLPENDTFQTELRQLIPVCFDVKKFNSLLPDVHIPTGQHIRLSVQLITKYLETQNLPNL